MTTRSLLALVPLLALLPSWPSLSTVGAPPDSAAGVTVLRGPGAVLSTVIELLAATDAMDEDALAACFVELGAHDGVEIAFDGDGGKAEQAKARALLFQDVARDGAVIEADTIAGAQKALLGRVAGDGVEVESRVVAARADCPSEHCSWAYVDFERTIRRGDDVQVVPMRATALARYDRQSAGMRLFGWHASAR